MQLFVTLTGRVALLTGLLFTSACGQDSESAGPSSVKMVASFPEEDVLLAVDGQGFLLQAPEFNRRSGYGSSYSHQLLSRSDRDGTVLWAKEIDVSGYIDATGLAVDQFRNAYLAFSINDGYRAQTIDLDGHKIEIERSAQVIASFSPGGQVRWVRTHTQAASIVPAILYRARRLYMVVDLDIVTYSPEGDELERIDSTESGLNLFRAPTWWDTDGEWVCAQWYSPERLTCSRPWDDLQRWQLIWNESVCSLYPYRLESDGRVLTDQTECSFSAEEQAHLKTIPYKLANRRLAVVEGDHIYYVYLQKDVSYSYRLVKREMDDMKQVWAFPLPQLDRDHTAGYSAQLVADAEARIFYLKVTHSDGVNSTSQIFRID